MFALLREWRNCLIPAAMSANFRCALCPKQRQCEVPASLIAFCAITGCWRRARVVLEVQAAILTHCCLWFKTELCKFALTEITGGQSSYKLFWRNVRVFFVDKRKTIAKYQRGIFQNYHVKCSKLKCCLLNSIPRKWVTPKQEWTKVRFQSRVQALDANHCRTSIPSKVVDHWRTAAAFSHYFCTFNFLLVGAWSV